MSSSPANFSNGVYARLIDDWLSKTRERGFESPFAQLLIAEGHQIVHIDSHSAREDGKDVISIDSSGKLWGFQLKAEDVSGERWRQEIEGELRELVSYPCHLPAVAGRLVDQAAIVVTGRLNETAQHKLSMFNAGLDPRYAKLQLWDKNYLQDRILSSNATLIPVAPEDMRCLLSSLASDGQELPDPMVFDRLLQTVEMHFTEKTSRRDLAAALLFFSLGLRPYSSVSNHSAELIGWTTAAAWAVRIAHMRNLGEDRWREPIQAACDSACRAADALAEEALARKDWLEGSRQGDGGEIMAARVTIVLGVTALSRLVKPQVSREDEEPYVKLIVDNLKHLWPWCESASPLFYYVYWYLSRFPKYACLAEDVLAYKFIKPLSDYCIQGRGVANPYYSLADSLLFWVDARAWDTIDESFRSVLYTVKPAVFLLARRLRRQLLNTVWKSVSQVNHHEMDIQNFDSWLQLRSATGEWRGEFFSASTKWDKLLEGISSDMQSSSQKIANQLSQYDKRLPLLTLLTHPNRCATEHIKWIDKTLDGRAI